MLNSISTPSSSSLYPKRLHFQRPLLIQRRVFVTLRVRVNASAADRDDRFKLEYTSWLIAGLGNPGNKYHGTRHNVGFEMIDQIAEAEVVPLNTICWITVPFLGRSGPRLINIFNLREGKIGSPPGTMDLKGFLLQKFSRIEQEQIDAAALDQGSEAVRTLVLTGFTKSITRFNLGQKYKFHRVQPILTLKGRTNMSLIYD